MSALTLLREQLKPLSAWWSARQARERRFLTLLALFLGCALLAQSLWTANAARTRLHRQLPQLKQQAEVVQRQAGEVRQLQAQPVASLAQDGPALLAAATQAARSTGLALAATQLQLEGARQIRVRANLPFDRWLEWVALLQKDARLRLVSCRIDGADASAAGASAPSLPGTVRVDALFALPEPA